MPLCYKIVAAYGACFAAISTFSATPAVAQVARTFVSGNGDDASANCTTAAPCRTFFSAHSKTASLGEIHCLDTASYGTVLITKSITIDCSSTEASISANGGTGVIINAAGVDVILRGLTINGGTISGSQIGVQFVQGNSLKIVDSIIMHFTASGAAGRGIVFTPSTAASLRVMNSIVTNNRTGIFISPTGSGSANVTLEDVTVDGNVTGLLVNAPSSLGAGSFVVATRSTFASNTTGVVLDTIASGSNYVVAKIVSSTITSNSGGGIVAQGATVRADVSGTTITNNGTGVAASFGAILLSYLDNLTDRNFVDGAFTGSVSRR